LEELLEARTKNPYHLDISLWTRESGKEISSPFELRFLLRSTQYDHYRSQISNLTNLIDYVPKDFTCIDL